MKRPAAFYSMWVTVLVMPLVYLVTWEVLTGEFSAEIKSMVIGVIIGATMKEITGFWLGSSASSQRKDESAT